LLQCNYGRIVRRIFAAFAGYTLTAYCQESEDIYLINGIMCRGMNGIIISLRRYVRKEI
jgi:hypothetical protein